MNNEIKLTFESYLHSLRKVSEVKMGSVYDKIKNVLLKGLGKSEKVNSAIKSNIDEITDAIFSYMSTLILYSESSIDRIKSKVTSQGNISMEIFMNFDVDYSKNKKTKDFSESIKKLDRAGIEIKFDESDNQIVRIEIVG